MQTKSRTRLSSRHPSYCRVWFGSLAVLLIAVACAPDELPDEEAPVAVMSGQGGAFEVWIVDQADSDHDQGMGGFMYVFADDELSGDSPTSADPLHSVDLAGATADLCREATGANPVRPHMLLFNDEGTHAVLSFVASGHVVIFDADTREPLECFRTLPGAGGVQQAHAAFPAPDGSYIVVANQNGKLLERIDTDFQAGIFSYNEDATLDLVNGMTPAGFPREDEDLRPDNAPICPVIAGDSRHTWVTLRGGGLFVVDSRETPMRIVAEYDRDTVVGNGCGGVEASGSMYLNSGGAPVNLQGQEHPVIHLHGFEVYRFPLDGYGEESPNVPAPELVFSADGERDSHGMAAVRDGRHIWVVDRHQDLAEVIDATTGEHVNTVSLIGHWSDNPAADLIDVSPSGERIFASFRGSYPLTGDPHNATGSSPGLGIIHVSEDGRTGEVIGVIYLPNVYDGRNVADPHAVRVRHLR